MYETFYKLRGKPFRLTPDPELLFPSKGQKRAMSYLLYGLELGEGFVMITGAVGTGKTLLIQKLLADLAQRNIAIASIASANLDGEDILPAVAAEFGLPFEGRSKESLLQALKQHLTTLATRHTHALLVVDEAQTLTPAALEMLRILSNLEQKGRALMQVFLVGQTELRQTIVDHHMEQLRQRIVASYRLEPLDAEESHAYILHRLNAVGWNQDPTLDPAVFSSIQQASRGIPRKINLIMDRLLLYGFLEEAHALDRTAITTVLDEMREEMIGTSLTLEPVPSPQSSAPPARARVSSTAARETELSELDLKRNTILLQLLREEIRLKQITQPGLAHGGRFDDRAITDEAIAELQRLRAGHQGS